MWAYYLRFRPHVSGYFGIRKFFFLDTASVNTYPVNPTYESATFWIRSPQWQFWIRYESGIVWTLNPDIFYPVMKQDRAQFFTVKGRERCKFPALDDACSVGNIPRGVLSTRVHPDTRIRVGFVWTGKFDLNIETCGRGNFWIRKEQVSDWKNIGIRVDGALGFEWMRGWGWRCFDGNNSFLSLWKLCLKNTS